MNGILTREDYVSRVSPAQNEEFKRMMKDARLRKGWRTQEEAGKAIGVSQSLISSFESRGMYDGMRFLDFYKVRKAYGISFAEIVRIMEGRDASPEEERDVQRSILVSKFSRIPEERRAEAIRAVEMLLDGYSR